MATITKIERSVPRIKKRLNVAAYCRVSVEMERTMKSFSAQVSYYNDLIQRNPEWRFAGIYSDGGLTGTSEKRAGLQDMLRDCEDGKIDIILTKSISRFARNTVDLLKTVRHLKELGVSVRFEKENIDSLTADGELMLTLLASFAQEEVTSLSTNAKWAVKKKFEQGIPNGKFRVFGYVWEGDHLVIVPEEAKVVRRIFQNFLDGKSRLETERELNGEGITTRSGSKWMDSNIKVILTNITYTGNLLLQKEYIDDPITKKRRKNRGELPQYFVEDTHEAIIDMETFQYVQDEMARRRALGALANKSLNVTCFTGKVKCGLCGQSFMHSTRKNRAKVTQLGERYAFWSCGTKKKKGGRCKSRSIRDDVLRAECAKALDMEGFDDEAFLERVEKIVVSGDTELTFHLKDGTAIVHEWERTGHRDCWTDEYRAIVSERRRSTPMTRSDIGCFSTKIKCTRCGCNFRKATQKSQSKKGGTHIYWRCASKDPECPSIGLREDYLKPLAAEVLGLSEFDDALFEEQIERIGIDPPTRLTFCFKDSRKVEREWTVPRRHGTPWTDEQRAKFRKSVKGTFTPERRKQMSENMKRIRKERGDNWRRRK
ncbi:recombinase family protein [Olsenella sp. HMSC062G07]|uniref:recombinase family protein n=1 Tax=Olsenella sp. HMSC062G07 TaxID=1739330 RepID=UPI0008A5E839|nr:recombinase family protein [Olsenella sp. HMSC062G07]OFK24143.1 resolvase [Olsenella sp. HMSC062G07]